MIEDKTILMLIASRLDNDGLRVLMQAGLWEVMRQFATLEQFWYLRAEHQRKKHLKWEPREWKKVYSYMSSRDIKKKVELFSHLDTVQVLIELGYIANNSMDFYMGASNCNLTILNLLERHGPKWRIENMGATLGTIVKNGKIEVLHWLLARYPEEVKSSAEYGAQFAARTGKVDMLRAMLELGGMNDDCLSNSIHDVCMKNHIEVLQILLDRVPEDKNRRDEIHCRALVYACTYGQIDLVRLLIDNYVHPGVDNNQALAEAIRYGKQEVVELLLADSRVNPGANKSKAFRTACEEGNLKIAQLLSQDRRVDEAAQDNGALRGAVLRKQIDIVKWLLTLDKIDPLGKSRKLDSLDTAARGKNTEIFDMLLRDRRVEMKDIAERMRGWIPLLRPMIEDKLQAYLLASAMSGCRVVHTDVILESLFKEGDTLHSIFQFILVKRPTSEELASWIGDCEDEEVELAIQSTVIKNKISSHTGELFSACRALILVLTGWNHVVVLRQMRQENGVTDGGMISAARLIAVHLGIEKFSFKLW